MGYYLFMTNAYRTAALATAEAELAAARQSLSAARTTKATRAAYEAIEFWSNKTAYLIHAAEEAK